MRLYKKKGDKWRDIGRLKLPSMKGSTKTTRPQITTTKPSIGGNRTACCRLTIESKFRFFFLQNLKPCTHIKQTHRNRHKANHQISHPDGQNVNVRFLLQFIPSRNCINHNEISNHRKNKRDSLNDN